MLRRRAPRSPAVLALLGLLGTLSGAALADPPAPPASPPSPAPAPSAAVPAPAAAPPAAAPPAPTTSDVAAPAVPLASPPAAPPAAAPAPAAPPAATLAAPAAPPRYDLAVVHLAADYPGAVLELRSFVDSGAWQVACAVPCDRALVTLGIEARVSAPGMSTFERLSHRSGSGRRARQGERRFCDGALRSASLGLAVGIPLGLAGTAMYSYGSYSDDDGLAIAGGVVLGTGAVMILAAIPLLALGNDERARRQRRQVDRDAPRTATE